MENCKSCGRSLDDHRGLIGTCAELQSANREIAVLKGEIEIGRARIAKLEEMLGYRNGDGTEVTLDLGEVK